MFSEVVKWSLRNVTLRNVGKHATEVLTVDAPGRTQACLLYFTLRFHHSQGCSSSDSGDGPIPTRLHSV